jgi:uncharacterized membrane protein
MILTPAVRNQYQQACKDRRDAQRIIDDPASTTAEVSAAIQTQQQAQVIIDQVAEFAAKITGSEAA